MRGGHLSNLPLSPNNIHTCTTKRANFHILKSLPSINSIHLLQLFRIKLVISALQFLNFWLWILKMDGGGHHIFKDKYLVKSPFNSLAISVDFGSLRWDGGGHHIFPSPSPHLSYLEPVPKFHNIASFSFCGCLKKKHNNKHWWQLNIVFFWVQTKQKSYDLYRGIYYAKKLCLGRLGWRLGNK